MKKVILFISVMAMGLMLHAQSPKSAEKGVTYGAGATAEGNIPVSDLDKKMKDNKFEGKVSGKVKEVCQEKGCWMKIEKDNGETMMVKFKDYCPQAQFVLFEYSGHNPQVEEPQALFKLLREFLTN